MPGIGVVLAGACIALLLYMAGIRLVLAKIAKKTLAKNAPERDKQAQPVGTKKERTQRGLKKAPTQRIQKERAQQAVTQKERAQPTAAKKKKKEQSSRPQPPAS